VIEPRVPLRLEGFALQPWEVWAIAIGAKDRLDATIALILPEEGVDVLPDDLALVGDLEEPAFIPSQMSVLPLGSRCAPLIKKLKNSHGAAPRISRRWYSFSIHLDDARLRARPRPHGMEAIVEDEDVAIREGIGVMLMPQLIPPPLPAEVTALLVDDRHGVQ
jgi:hypothetical protein